MHQKELEAQNEELRTLRQQAERSERKYLDLYDHAPAGYFTLAPNGKITEVNLTGAALLGKTREQILNSSLQDYIIPENRDMFIAFCRRIFESSQETEMRDHSYPGRYRRAPGDPGRRQENRTGVRCRETLPDRDDRYHGSRHGRKDRE